MEMHNAFNQQYVYRPHMSPPPNLNQSQSSQRFSPLNSLDLEDDDFEPLFGEGPSKPVVHESPDESSVEEVALVKRKYMKRRKPTKKNDKDVNEPWKPEEEVALRKRDQRKEATMSLTANGKIGFVISTSDSAHIGLNLNDEAADSGDEEIEESRLVGRDKTKRMGSTSVARSASSAATDIGLVDL
ncbi:hypothetical protein Tco_0305220 [Tanacetum coccineum]